MAQDPYVGQIRMFGGYQAPKGWMFCDGTALKISEYKQLYEKLKGTYPGGDHAKKTFALPDMRARVPVGQGKGPGLTLRKLGEKGGAAKVLLKPENMPKHTHRFLANPLDADTIEPASQAPALGSANPLTRLYSTNAPTVDMSSEAIVGAGGNQPHSNIMPSLGINFIIAVEPQGTVSSSGNFLSDPFIGEIRILPYEKGAPDGWVLCSCVESDVNRFPELQRVVSNYFTRQVQVRQKDRPHGESDKYSCWMPTLQKCVPMHPGQLYSGRFIRLGGRAGYASNRLGTRNIPTHTHQLRGDNTNKGAQSSNNPENKVFGQGRFQHSTNNSVYSQNMPDSTLEKGIVSRPVGSTGKISYRGSHKNLQPYLALNFYIAYRGIDPYPV